MVEFVKGINFHKHTFVDPARKATNLREYNCMKERSAKKSDSNEKKTFTASLFYTSSSPSKAPITAAMVRLPATITR